MDGLDVELVEKVCSARECGGKLGDAHPRDVDSARGCAPIERRGYIPARFESVRGWALVEGGERKSSARRRRSNLK